MINIQISISDVYLFQIQVSSIKWYNFWPYWLWTSLYPQDKHGFLIVEEKN